MHQSSSDSTSRLSLREKFERALARPRQWRLGLTTALDRDRMSVFSETPLVNPQAAALMRDPETRAVLLEALRGEWSQPERR